MSKQRNLEGLPEKYFIVPPGNDFDESAHSILMEQVEFLNTVIADVSDGNEISFETNYITAQLSHIIESLLYQANLIRKNLYQVKQKGICKNDKCSAKNN